MSGAFSRMSASTAMSSAWKLHVRQGADDEASASPMAARASVSFSVSAIVACPVSNAIAFAPEICREKNLRSLQETEDRRGRFLIRFGKRFGFQLNLAITGNDLKICRNRVPCHQHKNACIAQRGGKRVVPLIENYHRRAVV